MVTTTSTNSFLPENIPALVSHLLSNQPASFHLDTADKPFSGSQPHVYVVKVTDGSTWGVRVPIPQANHMSRESITFCVEEEVKILNGIEQSGFSKSPRLLGYDSGYDNAIGFPYIVLTWIEGSPAEWPDSIPASRITRNKFLRQLAKIMLELAECTQKPSTQAASEYPLSAIDRQILRISDNQLPGLNIRDCLFKRALVPSVVHSSLENAPALLSHEDLSKNNIIVDKEYNIQGIIDWGFASFLPFQFASYFPRILAIERPDEEHSIQPDGVATFSQEFLTPSAILLTDRECFTTCISLNKESSLAPLISAVLSAPDVDWRNLMAESARSKGLHKWLADRSWLVYGLPYKADFFVLSWRRKWGSSWREELEKSVTLSKRFYLLL